MGDLEACVTFQRTADPGPRCRAHPVGQPHAAVLDQALADSGCTHCGFCGHVLIVLCLTVVVGLVPLELKGTLMFEEEGRATSEALSTLGTGPKFLNELDVGGGAAIPLFCFLPLDRPW